jgi:hypothetical protein
MDKVDDPVLRSNDVQDHADGVDSARTMGAYQTEQSSSLVGQRGSQHGITVAVVLRKVVGFYAKRCK